MTRQPIHTVYGGANLFQAATCAKFGKLAEKALATYAPDATALAAALDLPSSVAETLYARVLHKLRREPVEDLRVDFEDGFGYRADAEEDAAADQSAKESAAAFAAGTLPASFGIRVKAFTPLSKSRAIRTLHRYLGKFLKDTGGRLPEGFVVVLPKITSPSQVSELVSELAPYPSIRVELMAETPESLVGARSMVEAAEGRVSAVHFGPYDYTASLGVTAFSQRLDHPACDYARLRLQLELADTGVLISDGPTVVMPVPIHRDIALTPAQTEANLQAVHHAWRMHYANVRRALDHGYYQGWDLHPAQLVTRYAAVYAFFLESLPLASERLKSFMALATQASMVGTTFDDAATGEGLLNFFRRALNCGAIEESEIPALTGLSAEELRLGSVAGVQATRSAVQDLQQ